MAKKPKSQWDFGELFPPAATRRVLSVTELTGQIKRLLEQQVGQVWVSGEITNLRAQSSGHNYFTLKDAGAQLNCVLFRGEATAARGVLEDGRKVLLQGDLTVYEPRGQYQLIVHAVELQGVGALQLAFEQLKARLAAEGLFDPARKRPLPAYPQRLGLVTSPTGAALRDVLHVVERRNPALDIILVPCRVQGQGAAAEIAAGIRLLNEFSDQARAKGGAGLDVILLTRGGGSLEDLWAFNEEAVARAIFESALPVMSAVGHEIDFTISDFVADVRAATPSAGAELLTQDVFASRAFVAAARETLEFRVRQQWERKAEASGQLAARLARCHPRRRLNEWAQRLDDLQSSLARGVLQGTRERQLAWRNLAERLWRLRPAQVVAQRREVLEQEERRLRELARHRFQALGKSLTLLESRLRLLGPEQVLARGYSITRDAATGQVLRDAARAQAGQQLATRLHRGEILSRVEPR
jgi:exodeoxyribonuclease VII large subunit